MLDLLENVYVFAAMAITTAVALGIYLWRSITRLYRATKAKLRHNTIPMRRP
jgi:hypothetical protein